MFLDASAIVAMLADEDERTAFLERLSRENDPITSPMAVFEAVLAIARRKGLEPRDVEEAVGRFLTASNVRLVSIGAPEQASAIDAHARFGKGRGHPAQLNMGDCFAYACARTNGRPLLFKGDDFGYTDIDIARV